VIKRILSIFLLMAFILVGCNSLNPDNGIPTQISIPTSEPTSVPTQTAAPTNVPLPQPTELFIPQTDAVDPKDQAYLRTVHASPDLGVVDVYIEALAIGTNLDYGRFTEREGIVAGRYKLRILPSASFITDVTLYEEELTVFGGQSLIFMITGTAEAITVTTLNEPNEPLSNDTSRLLMINALEGADNMVMLVDDTPQTAITPYLHISETTEHRATFTNFIFQNAGSTLIDTELDLRERRNYTFILIGSLSRPDTQDLLILTSDAPGVTQVRLINAAPALFRVDIYFNSELFATGVSYSEISESLQLLSGTYDISIYISETNPDEGDPIVGTQFIANPDEDIILVLVGETNNFRFVTYRNNQQPTYTNRARITFVNALDSAPNILLRSSDSTLEHTLGYGRLSDTYEINTDAGVNFTWIHQLDDVQDVILEDVSNFRPSAGNNYLYVFAGRGYDNPIVHASEVGTLDFAFEEVPIVTTTVPTSRPTKIRLVNMWEDLQFVVRLDGTVIAEGIEFGKATNELVIGSGEHTIGFYELDSEFPTVEVTNEFLATKRYSVIAFDFINADENTPPAFQGDTLIIDDTDVVISSVSGAMRLIVLDAEPDSTFGVGYSAPSPNIEQPTADEKYRRSLFIGIEQLIRQVEPRSASDMHTLPVGTYNLQIIDNEEVAITFTHAEQPIELKTLYNIFLREVSETGQTNTIIVPYTP